MGGAPKVVGDTFGFWIVSLIQPGNLETLCPHERVSTLVPLSILALSLHIHSHCSSGRWCKRYTYSHNMFLSKFGSIGENPQDFVDSLLQFLGVALRLGAELSCVSRFSALSRSWCLSPSLHTAHLLQFLLKKSSCKDMFIDLKERGRVRGKEKHHYEREALIRETSIGSLLYMPHPGIEPST